MPRPATRRGRVAILTGCAQSVLDPGINEAAIRLLTRLGVEVVVPRGEACCGSLVHHMGREEAALDAARRNIDVWIREIETRRARRDHHHRVGLRHDDQGLWLHAAPRSGLCRQGGAHLGAGQRRHGISRDARPAGADRAAGPRRRLSFRLLDAARPEDHAPAEGTARQGRLRRSRSRARGISAAARPAPTTSCSRRSRPSCATAR